MSYQCEVLKDLELPREQEGVAIQRTKEKWRKEKKNHVLYLGNEWGRIT